MARVLELWEGHCAYPRLPRHLAPRLEAAGLAVDAITAFPLVNRSFEASYSRGVAALVSDDAGRMGGITAAEVAAWRGGLFALHAAGRYFFASSRFVFAVSRPASS